MKFVTMTIISLLFSVSASAALTYTQCDNWHLVGDSDSYIEVALHDNGQIELTTWESNFVVDTPETKVTPNGITYAVLNRKVMISSEGTPEAYDINLIMTLSHKNKTLNLAISYDLAPFISYELACKEVPVEIGK